MIITIIWLYFVNKTMKNAKEASCNARATANRTISKRIIVDTLPDSIRSNWWIGFHAHRTVLKANLVCQPTTWKHIQCAFAVGVSMVVE